MSNGMKRVLALLYFGVLAMGSIYAQGIEFFHGTYEEALQKARAEGKQIFVDVYTCLLYTSDAADE